MKQATLWKNRGNQLYKENEFDLMAKYYSLAMEFTPPSNKDTMSALLSNRCFALTSSKKLKEALADAKDCIALKPQWFQVSSYLAFKHHRSELCFYRALIS